MANPKLSMIVPVYNVEKNISECIDSILAQTYTDYELILIDDGSLDNSGIICDKYTNIDSRVVVTHQSNAGVSEARNKGIELARGEWITFVDSDDWLDKNFLEMFDLENAMELSISGLRYIKCPERSIMNIWAFEEKEIDLAKDFESIAKSNLLEYGTTVCKAYRKQILDKYHIRFDRNISYHEDHLFFFQYLRHTNKVATHKGVGYNYRIDYSAQSLSKKTHPWDKLNQSSDAMFRELTQLKCFKMLPEWYRQKISTFCLYPKINACQAIFTSHISESERKSAYAIITCEHDIIKRYFRPAKSKSKILKGCVLAGYLPLRFYFMSIRTIKRIIRK